LNFFTAIKATTTTEDFKIDLERIGEHKGAKQHQTLVKEQKKIKNGKLPFCLVGSRAK
jgi:hypothetical protein